MELPEGFLQYSKEGKRYAHKDKSQLVLKLHKTIYGVVQAARAFNDTFNNVMVNTLKFKQSQSDPCIYYQKDSHRTVIIAVYVNDGITIGNKEAIQHAKDELQRNFRST